VHLDAPLADPVAHLAGAAVERLARPEADARAALAHRHRDAAVVAVRVPMRGASGDVSSSPSPFTQTVDGPLDR